MDGRCAVLKMKNSAGIILLVCVAVSSALMVSCAADFKITPFEYGEKAFCFSPEAATTETVIDAETEAELSAAGYKPAASTKVLSLFVNEEEQAVKLVDKRGNNIWSSAVDIDSLSRQPNQVWRNRIKSLFTFKYSNGEQGTNELVTVDAYNARFSFTTESGEDFIRFNYDFTTAKIKLSFVLRLENDSMLADIPFESIKEYGKNKLVVFSVLPYFAAAGDSESGGYIYPNGSGEIYRFKPAAQRQSAMKDYILPVYGPNPSNLDSAVYPYDYDRLRSVSVPFFGVQKEDGGLAAIIEKGDCDAAINITPGGVSVEINRIYTELYYRYFFDAKLTTSPTGKAPVTTAADKNIIPGDRSVRYVFLTASQNDYNYMARAVKKRFAETGRLPEKSSGTGGIVMDLFGGIYEDGFLWDNFKELTSFSNAESIISGLFDSGIKNFTVNLRGFNKNGYLSYPSPGAAAGQLGGAGGYKSAAAKAKELGITLLNEINVTDAYKSSGGFSFSNNSARNSMNLIISGSDYSECLLKPDFSMKLFSKSIAAARSAGAGGITLERAGTMLYEDMSFSPEMRRGDCAGLISEMLKKSAGELGAASVQGANAYIWRYAGLLRDVPEGSDKLAIGDESIPFLQLILFGSVDYTGLPFNLTHNSTVQTLKFLEYGYIPSLELTWNDPNELIRTNYNRLFSSRYENWKDEALELYKTFSTVYAGAGEIVSHSKISENVYCTYYSNEVRVYVNYSKTAFKNEDVDISPVSYLIKNGD